MKPTQQSLATAGFEMYRMRTRRDEFLSQMDQVVPWAKLCALIEPYYPKAGKGRRPKELEQMLRIYFVQQWFNLSDPQAEDALYDIEPMRRFAGVELVAATDVDNPLAGLFGAAKTFGPQKGLAEDDIVRVDGALEQFAAAKDLPELRARLHPIRRR